MATSWSWARQIRGVLYQDTVTRGPSRMPFFPVRTASTAVLYGDNIETIASEGLRSLVLEKKPARASSVLQSSKPRQTSKLKLQAPEKSARLGESLYTQRHKWRAYTPLVKLIERGAIVEAMTRFHSASRKWLEVVEGRVASEQVQNEISPHIIDELIDRFARIATSDLKKWTRVIRQKTSSESYWVPTHKDTNSNTNDMDVPTLAFYAMIDMYDIGGSFGILPSPSSMCAVFYALSNRVSVEEYHKSVHLTLLRLGGRSLEEAQKDFAANLKRQLDSKTFKALSPQLLQGILEGYGMLGVPHIGEALLCEWSSHITQEEGEPSTSGTWQSMMTTTKKKIKPVWVDSSEWSSDLNIWIGLIKSRASSCDLEGALHWLQHYRQEGLPMVQVKENVDCSKPYMAYIRALTSLRKKEFSPEHGSQAEFIPNSKTRYHAICDAITTMQRDGVEMALDTLMMTVNLHLGYHEFEKALSIIRLLFQGKYTLPSAEPSFYKIFFRLHRLIYYCRPFDVAQLANLSNEAADGKMLFVGNVRTITQEFVSGLNRRVGRWSYKAVQDTLTEGLRASMGAQDYPLASHILTILKGLHISTRGQIQLLIANHFNPEETKENPRQRESRNQYRITVAENMMQQLKDSNIEKTYFQETVYESKYINKFDADEWMTTMFINYLDAFAVEKVRVTLGSSLPASEPQWVHDAWQIFHQKSNVSDDDIVKAILSPIEETIEPLKRW